jgi:outer membrane protein TolC
MTVRTTTLAALMVLGAGSGAASGEALTRAEAVARALEANPEVAKGRENLKAYAGRAREATADALPELTVLGTALRYRDPSLLNSSSFDAFPPELRQSLTPVPTNLVEGSGLLRQTLFSFKLGHAIRAARLASSLGQEELQQVRQQVALLAVRAYDGYVLALEKVVVGEKSVRQKEKHLEMARVRRAAGVATDLDVLRPEVDLANTRAVLVRLRAEADLARGNLNAVMLRPVDAPIEPADRLEFVPLETTVEQAVSEAVARRPEVKGSELRGHIQDELVGVARADGRPHLDLEASYGFSVRRPTNFFGSDFAKWNVGVTLTVPVFDGFRTAGRVAQAQAERAKTAQDRLALENQIRLEAKQAVDRLTAARQVLDAAALNVTQAERALEMTQANYKHGAATTIDVLDAQAALTLAESLRLQGLHEHADARATLRYVMARDPLQTVEGP